MVNKVRYSDCGNVYHGMAYGFICKRPAKHTGKHTWRLTEYGGRAFSWTTAEAKEAADRFNGVCPCGHELGEPMHNEYGCMDCGCERAFGA
jgi:hypothetical protein